MSIELLTPEVEISKIDVEEGHNARKTFDPAALARLARSIEKTGVVQPLSVKEKEDGRFSLVAGERRLRAAQIAGRTKVPVAPRDDDGETAAIVENLHDEKLNPIEEAAGLKALKESLGLATNKALAAEIGMSGRWVGGRLKLLKLPKGAQEAIAKGAVPAEAEPLLREVTTVSPRIAECACELAEREQIPAGEFVEEFTSVLCRIPDATFDDPPTMIPTAGVRFSAVILDRRERLDLAARYRAPVPGVFGTKTNPELFLRGDEVDAGRAAGVLLETKGMKGEWFRSLSFITDREWAEDLLRRYVEGCEKEAAKRAKEAEKAAKEAEERGEAAEVLTEAQRLEKEAKARAERREKACQFNDRLGHRLLKRAGAASRKKFGLARKKAIAIQLMKSDRYLLAGARLVFPQLQTVQAPSGSEQPRKTTYATLNEAAEYVLGRIDRARSDREVDELLADVLIASELADGGALERGEYHCSSTLDEKVLDLLKEEIQTVRPRKTPAKKS